MRKKIQFTALEITVVASLLFLSGCTPIQAAPPDTLTIVHISDTHAGNLAGFHPGFVALRDGRVPAMDSLGRWLHAFPMQTGAEAVVITGDMLDCFEAETARGSYLATQIEQFAAAVMDCPVPLFLTLGNHDITSYRFEEPKTVRTTQTRAQRARAAWIKNIPCFQSGTYYSRSFRVGRKTVRMLFLDNGYGLSSGSFLDEPQLDWVRAQVREAGDDPVVLFMHKYLAIPDANGDGVLFTKRNVLAVDEKTCSTGFLKILNEHRNIKALFAGHGHHNVTEPLVLPSGHRIVQVETGGFGDDPKNRRIIRIMEKQITILPCGEDRMQSVIPLD